MMRPFLGAVAVLFAANLPAQSQQVPSVPQTPWYNGLGGGFRSAPVYRIHPYTAGQTRFRGPYFTHAHRWAGYGGFGLSGYRTVIGNYPFFGYYSPYSIGGFFPGGYGYGVSPTYDAYPYWPYTGAGAAGVSSTTVAPSRPAYTVELSGQLPATLDLEFPAPATIWLSGKKTAGEPATKRSLTSDAIRPGETHTFHVRARWYAGGHEYEWTRDVTLGPGDRSRLLVVSGKEVADEK